MRSLLVNPTSDTRFPMGPPCEPHPDFGAPLANGLYALWLPKNDPRMWFNVFRLNSRRIDVPSEFAAAYYQRRPLTAVAPSGLAIPTGSGGNVPTPFGQAIACSNESVAWGGGSIGDAPAFVGGTGKVISVCLWFRINRVNGSGFPTICSTSYTTGWWLGIRTATGMYKCIFRNSSSPYGPFEWGSYGSNFGKVQCISFVLPMDANGTATVYHNGVQVVQATIANASASSGSANVFPLSTSTTGMFVEIFGYALWTRSLYPDEMRQLVDGPRVLLAKRQTFWYGPMLAFVAAQIAGGSTQSAGRVLGRSRTALIAGASGISAYIRVALSRLRTWRVPRESRTLLVPAESRTLVVRPDKRRFEP